MSEWKEYKLGEITESCLGKMLDAKKNRGIPQPYLANVNVRWGSFYLEDLPLMRFEESESERYGLKFGDIVVCEGGEPGRCAIWKEQVPNMKIQKALHRVRCHENVDYRFLYYYLMWAGKKGLFDQYCTGSTIKHLPGEKLKTLPIKLPPLADQQRIAGILSSLDDKIELNNKINDNLEKQAQALFKNWFIDGKEKNGVVGDYCDVKSGFAFKSSWWRETGIKVIRIGDIEQDCLNLNSSICVPNDKIEIAKNFLVRGGDLVIAMTGATIGKFAMVPMVDETILVNQRVGKFFLGDNPLNRVPFIYCTFKQDDVLTEFINRGQGSAQPNISAGDILSIPCWIPEKGKIENFNQMAKPLFESIVDIQSENQRLATLRDTLLPKLMFGEC